MLDQETILLAEDDENDVALIQRAFRKAGLRESLKLVPDGERAIEYLAGRGAYADRERFPMPFLVLLDLKMPGVNGFEVLQWARAQPDLKRLLIVVLTSSNLQEDVDRSYELGANSYLVKPVEFKDMVNLVQRFEAYWTELNRIPTGSETLKLARPEPSLL
ncbi:Response regulator [Verrucomicrobia bacterium]|nr:Response regulator [Verrucomicrobiota bacterium]